MDLAKLTMLIAHEIQWFICLNRKYSYWDRVVINSTVICWDYS
jgi:hypothetical protein